jgi:hypothetical protein
VCCRVVDRKSASPESGALQFCRNVEPPIKLGDKAVAAQFRY